MFNKISSFVLALVLFGVLVGSSSHISLFMASMVVLMAAAFVINLRRIGLSWPHLLLPLIFLLGTGSVFMVITGPTARVAFLVASAIAFYFVEANLGQESHFLQNAFLLSVFELYVGIFALNFYLHLSTAVVVLVVFLTSFILTIQGFAGFSLPAKKYFYFLIAWSLAEAAWGLTLWPTHYIVSAVVLFCMFYLLWMFSFSAFFGKLTWKKIYLQVGLVALVLIATLATASWQPLIQ
jgi:hypothetical protein